MIDRSNVIVREFAVEAALERDREAVHHAVHLDPPTAVTPSLEEIRSMTNERFEADPEYLPGWE